jgi:2-oxoisovalerate dehydrogenase E1 component
VTITAETARRAGVRERFAAFLAERHPFALKPALAAFDRSADIEQALRDALTTGVEIPETTPGVSAGERLQSAVNEVVEACRGFFRREEIIDSLTHDEKLEMLRGMILTRAVDNRLKQFFTGGEVRWKNTSFQGKGFRSLGQEAIYAAPMRLRRGPGGDVISPMIRDLGAALCMHNAPETIRLVLNAQMGKAGPPMNGKDLHVGDFEHGILPAMAPLGSPSLTIAGVAMAFAMAVRRSPFAVGGEENATVNSQQRTANEMRVAVSFIGEGGTSLGEWHEAINACAARKLPAIFCVQNNQTGLATPVHEQSAVRVFADKAIGYGIPAISIDGTDPEQIAGAFAWAAERARAGQGPTLIELVAMRMCGHAHHDDMLYLGKDPQPSWSYPPLTDGGYADRALYEFWFGRDPIATYAAKLEIDIEPLKREAEELVEREARAVIEAPWPEPSAAREGVYTESVGPASAGLGQVETGPPFDPKGKTFLEAVMLGVGDALRNDPRAFVYGEDVGGKYGNAFLLLRPLLGEFGDRIINSILSEGATIGVCVGAALAGMRPIGEIQFNDFVATGFNQLVNNAAKIHYRWGASVPMVLRMPWGGLRHAGPYHSQNTEAWFYRTPGLKIVVPSTPHDARALMASAVADPDPVLYYEHIALYRDPRIKQMLSDAPPEPIPIGKAALRRNGKDLAIISYGAYVHVAMRVAEKVDATVLDLRTLAPLDRAAILALTQRCNRVMIIEEDTRTGSVGESIAAIIQEEAFDWLDAPIRIIGALDTPVPYSPPLEEEFLPSEEEIEAAARDLLAY